MARGSRRTGGSRRGDQRRNTQDDVPAIFQEMLQEASGSGNPPPRKRRRVGEMRARASGGKSAASAAVALDDPQKADGNEDSEADKVTSNLQRILDSSEYSDESEFEWEDVELKNEDQDLGEVPNVARDEPLSITIGGDEPSKHQPRRRVRKPITSAEKKIRLDIHKAHILFLLFHCFARNQWCDDSQLQGIVRSTGLIPPKLITKLHPEASAIQLQRSKIFKEAITQICEIWHTAFTITLRGIRRPTWLPSTLDISRFRLPENAESFLDIREFRSKARELEGSADFGAQLFCALLRSLGVETRLVCSLQVLPFGALGPVSSPAPTFGKNTVYAADYSEGNAADDERAPVTESLATESTPTQPRPIQRIGRSRNDPTASAPSVVSRRSRRVPGPRHPIFWVEVLDTAYQKWISVDPLALNIVGRPLKFEPALNDPDNSLSYVIAFEEGGVAKDVTRRYVKAYNAKTRKLRVESTDGGQKWFESALKPFRRRAVLDRDQVEEAALVQRELSEGIPKNIQDFKDHPVYVLERHLRHNEVIYPKREVGKIGQLSRGSDLSSTEPIYRRKDVHIVRNSDRWFRLGRDIKAGEVPLKRAAKRTRSRRQRGRSSEMEELDPDQTPNEDVGLYAIFQTELYVPPPIVNGKVPKNVYGNIDVYVASMVPPGGVHILSPQARQAARTLNIDYADAVTGFQFKGRHGTAVINGIVVAREYKEAMLATLRGIADAQEQALEETRSAEALRLWRKFAIGLRIVDRVRSYMGDDEVPEDDAAVRDEIDAEMEIYEQNHRPGVEDFGGGFLPNADAVQVVESTATQHIGQDSHQLQAPFSEGIHRGGEFMEVGGGFSPDFNDDELGKSTATQPQTQIGQNSQRPRHSVLEEEYEAGGFVQDESDRGREFLTQNTTSLPSIKDTSAAERARAPAGSDTSRVAMTLRETVDEAEDPKQEESRADEEESAEALDFSDGADAQSLLSHDPEDEDADPDWLD